MKQPLEPQIQEAMGDIAYDLEQMFPEREGMFGRSRTKAKLKIIKNLLPGLRSALLEGEELRYVARGYILRWWEQMFAGGGVAYYTNITCVVLTDRRILLVNTNGRGRQQHFRNQIPYTELREVKMRSSLSTAAVLKLKDGTKLTMGGFRGADRKQMQRHIPELIEQMPEGAPRLARSLQYVCPNCAALYTELTPACAVCHTPFKNARKAALMSLFLPGLGDMYLGHRVFGLGELIGSIVEWVVLIAAVGAVINGEPDSVGFLAVWVGVVVVTNVIDYFLTRAMGRKGLIAAGKPAS